MRNALGQRSRKTIGGADVVYLYDLEGNLFAEHDATGTLIRDYVWMNGAPVAQIDQGEEFSYLHFDHLNTPRLATDDNQTIVWRWDSDAFGTTLPDEDPDGDGNGTTVNLRFPGQYFDQETGFHYNYFRTYDPSTGRYLESDPIGLDGGLNTYGYVSQNPLRYIDPKGQALTLPAGAAAGRACLSNGACAGTMGALTGASVACLLHPSLCSEIITEACADASDAIASLLKPFQNNLLPLDSGGEEWGRRNGVGGAEGRRRAHGVKQRDPMSRPKDDYKVDPDTGDVVDREGEVIGNLEDDYQ